jgi:hypothetical protein
MLPASEINKASGGFSSRFPAWRARLPPGGKQSGTTFGIINFGIINIPIVNFFLPGGLFRRNALAVMRNGCHACLLP